MTDYMKMPKRDNKRPVALGTKIDFEDLVKIAAEYHKYPSATAWWRVVAEDELKHLVSGAPKC